MGIAAIILGCISILLYLVSVLPLMRFVDVLTLPIALVGTIVGIVAVAVGSHVTLAIIGLLLSVIALIFGYGRLVGHRPMAGRPV